MTVDFETENLEATKGDDYEKTQGTMVLSPGQIRKSVFVPVHRDRDAYARHDRFVVKFFNAKGGHLSEDDGQCMFLDNGAPMALMGSGGSISQSSVIAPSVLIDDLEMERMEEEFPKIPIVPSPT